MNINDVSTQLMYTTVPIYAQNQDKTYSSGTGFIFSVRESDTLSIPLLVTNYHVLENAVAGFFELHIAENGEPTDKSVRVQFDRAIISGNRLGNLDLIAVPLAATLNDFAKRSVELFFRSVDQKMIPTQDQWDNFAAIEDITFIGYPNGLYDDKNKMSIIRKGITATPIWNNFKGEEAFLIDAGVFPGSSGSPVFIYNKGSFSTKDGLAIGNRLLFVGVISQTMLRTNATGKDFLDLGKVINSKAFYHELELLIRKLKNT